MNNHSENNQPTYPAYFEEEIHLRDYIRVLRRRWKSLSMTFLAIVAVTAVYTLAMRPVYEADTLLQVAEGSRTSGVLGELAAVTRTANPVETEIEILKSRSLGSEVVRRLGLDVSVSGRRDGSIHRILGKLGLDGDGENLLPAPEIMEVPPDLLGEPLWLRFDKDAAAYQVFHDKDMILKGTLGKAAVGNGLRLKIPADGKDRSGREFLLVKSDLRRATRGLIARLKVSQVGRNTQVVRVSYQDVDPIRAAGVVETLTRAYIERDVEGASLEANVTLTFIRDQIAQVKNRLESAQGRLDDYKVKTGSVALTQEAELLVQRISDLEVEANRLAVTRAGIDRLVESLGGGGPIVPGSLEALGMDSQEMSALMSGYLELMRKRADLLKDYTPENPAVRSLNAQVSLAAEQIRAAASAVKGALKTREKAVKDVLDTYRSQLEALPEIQRELARLQKDVLIQEKIYSFLLEKEQETQIVKASTVSNVRVVDAATVPMEPIKPRSRRNLMLGLILGLMLGVGVAFLLEYFDDTVGGDDDLEAIVGIPVYGTVQYVRKAHERRKEKKPHLVIEEPRSPITEGFRSLRTNILFSRAKERPRVIAVSSPGPGEGKSFVVANLASLSAYAGKRTLVVDADLRKPQQHIVFGASQKPGLTDVLTGKVSLDEALQGSVQENLDLLAAGSLPPNPSELLGSEEMGKLLTDLRERYDFILLDSPPLGLVTDPALLMNHSDLGLIVARAGMTPRGSITHAADAVKRLSPDMQLGLVLNAVKSPGGYGYKYKYSGYGKYGY